MYFICKKYFKAIEYGKLLKYSAKIIVINLPLATLLYYVLLPTDLVSLYKLLAGTIIYLVVFILMIRIKGLGIDKTNSKNEKV